ncbi:hypothetical protein GJ744_009384 [Endocarpon pusillum]|uniref:Uncharacterized protein n=1 Tax=Endocarpon pusillum TaxID=364733 RepID=A0A8H7E2M2_9EURO|nr:hypothetical protein GJ744_009384 [Endocarpon pusillum]
MDQGAFLQAAAAGKILATPLVPTTYLLSCAPLPPVNLVREGDSVNKPGRWISSISIRVLSTSYSRPIH